ncbi:hypothetical protein DESUT3_13650 [Desulfuromonas versatilis]|uniref:Transposase IS200-like domain-containing protein n=1 Tax=Desulfuromonas versatilis TaxID=2802975 RepID=A0ABM8HQX9_9BACT|nr:hypothetical protein [Desulfuromonas versatilis]BCR04296.1 hypothetical protein DESUT3_13650 [Desulfuromonas versatilis]
MDLQTMKSLSGIPWEIFLTVHLPRDTANEQQAYKILQAQLIRPLSKYLRTQLAAIGVHNRLRGNHAHLVIISSTGKKFQGVTTGLLYRILEAAGSPLVKDPKSIHMETVRDEGSVAYIRRNLPDRSGKGGLLWFNRYRLKNLFDDPLRWAA